MILKKENNSEDEFDFSNYGNDFIEQLKNVVSAAKKADPHYHVFGSSSHKYSFGQPASKEDIEQIEKKFNIRLPKAYVDYMTLAGNGRAGPHYGLYRLEQLDRQNEYLLNNEFPEAFIDKNMTLEKWNSAAEELEKTDDDDKYEMLMRKIISGALVIGTHGCTVDTLLMCSGSEYGKIVYIDWNMDIDNPPKITGLTFEKWILTYFHKIAVNDLYSAPHSKMKLVVM